MKASGLLRLFLLCVVMNLQASAVEHAPVNWQDLPGDKRVANLKHRRLAPLQAELRENGFKIGNPAFIRIFKESHELELWLQKSRGAGYELFKTYRIAYWSGTLGPKQKEGDGQAPEGVYGVTRKRLNPASKYHLSFNIGYPNAHDTAHGCTGGLIMVHGKNVSIGCYAMTDPLIEEIYLIVDAALAGGQVEIPVHCFPFRMTAERLAQAKAEDSPWLEFWNTLAPISSAFDKTHRPPHVIQGVRYALKEGP
jgi:murein L,D-transpeptidase YafK